MQEAAARAEEAARLHREFMSMLRQVLDGHMDSSTFEDSCRALLGTNSYVLFTLDKLIQKFIKHMAVSNSCWGCWGSGWGWCLLVVHGVYPLPSTCPTCSRPAPRRSIPSCAPCSRCVLNVCGCSPSSPGSP